MELTELLEVLKDKKTRAIFSGIMALLICAIAWGIKNGHQHWN